MIEQHNLAAAHRSSDWLRPAVALTAIGWGANQFAPLIVLYQQGGISATASELMFGLYAVGLVPALLIGGRWSDRVGRRPVIAVAVVLSVAASTVLMSGSAAHNLLFLGRFLAGLSSGLAFGTGAAWIRELSAAGSDRHAGARRATVAMTIGFGVGPLVAGILAQWSSQPAVWAYVPHLALCAVALVALAGAAGSPPAEPTPEVAHLATPTRPPGSRSVARHLMVVSVPFAPWVFATAAIALAYLPALVAADAGGDPLLFAGIATAIPAFAGVAAQPLLRRWGARHPAALVVPSMVAVTAELGVAAWAAYVLTIPAVLVAAVVLGVAYGLTQFTGLAHVQHIADPTQLGSATSRYQALSYLGFALPYVLTAAHTRMGWSPSASLTTVGALALAATVWVALAVREEPRRGA